MVKQRRQNLISGWVPNVARTIISDISHITPLIFTVLHGMQTGSCDEISVRLSVRPSVKRVHCDKTEESYV